MGSLAKKKKAKNSYIYNGGEKNDGMRMKRVQYFTKQDRNRIKNEVYHEYRNF